MEFRTVVFLIVFFIMFPFQTTCGASARRSAGMSSGTQSFGVCLNAGGL